MTLVLAEAVESIKNVAESRTKNPLLPMNRVFQVVKHKRILPVISAFLLILAYPRFNFGFFAWIAFVPLFFALETDNIRERIFSGYIFGLVSFSGILYWIFRVSVPGGIALILFLSIYPALFCFYRIKGELYDIFMIPSLWVFTEFLRAHIFTGFPWALLGYSQSATLPLIQIADITGVYGVSFLVVLVNLSIYAILKRSRNRMKSTIITLVVIILVLVYGAYRLRQPAQRSYLKVAVIQGNIPQHIKWDLGYKDLILNKYERLSLQASESNPDIVIWPETSVPGLLEGDDHIYEKITALAKTMDSDLVVGAIKERNQNLYNSAYLVSGAGNIVSSYDKVHLVPFGEYVPFEKYMPWFRDVINKPIGESEFGKKFTSFKIKTIRKTGTGQGIIRNLRFYKFSVMICFEDIFPYLARKFVAGGAEFLVNITNDAWFGKTSAPYQHMQASIFRAVENKVPVIRSANTGVSCIIDRSGKVISLLEKDGEAVFVEGYALGVIYPSYRRTLYTLYGDIFAIVCIGVVLLGTFWVQGIRFRVRGIGDKSIRQ